jgi:cytochrome c oxidase subunit 2
MVVLMRSCVGHAVLTLAGALTIAGASAAYSARAAQPAARRVDIAAERFSFTPSEIKATVGTPLEIRLTSDDTAHGFRLVGVDVNIEIPKRGRGAATVRFTPERAGRYSFECSKLCGAGHSFMRGVIVVSDAPGERGRP